MLRIEYEDPVRSGPCDCCGGTTTSLTRFVYSDGDAYAVYYARFSNDHPDREVRAAVSLGEWGEGSSPAERRSFALQLRASETSYQVSVVDASDSPWRGAEILGPMLDREEALAHPWIREVFHITDHMVTEDSALKSYLDATG